MRALHPRLRPYKMTLLLAAVALSLSGCFGRYAYIGVGTAIDILPHGYVSISVDAVPYYYHHGVFYQRYRRGFIVVTAPFGATLMGPPPGHVIVMVENDPWAYYRGVFYRPRGPRYVVSRPPLGVFVRSLPPAAISRRIDGVEYKEYAGTYYRPAIRNGRRGYQVTDPPPRR